jgi:hypothetical protein
MRDLNDEMLNNPFDDEMKSIVVSFAALLKPIVETIDPRGLDKHFLQKHQKVLIGFIGSLTCRRSRASRPQGANSASRKTSSLDARPGNTDPQCVSVDMSSWKKHFIRKRLKTR